MKFLAVTLLSLPAFVLSAPALDTSALDTSLIFSRQSQVRPVIESARAEHLACQGGGVQCVGCPTGGGSINVMPPGLPGSDSQATIGFNSWNVGAEEGNPTSVAREMACRFTFNVRYPVGRTCHQMVSGFHGFVDLPAPGGMEAKLTRSYVISAGGLLSPQPGEIMFNSSVGTRNYNAGEDISLMVEAGSGPGQDLLRYTIDMRAFVTTSGQRSGWGRWSLDDFSVSASPGKSC